MTDKLKQRFCKDMNLSIQLFNEPYFENRVKLLGKYEQWQDFNELLKERFNNNEEAFLAEYNALKDEIINYIKESEAFNKLNSIDMNEFAVKTNIRQSDVYKMPNVGKGFMSIDMRRANFSSLVTFGKNTNTYFFNSCNWQEFMSKFTGIKYFMDSKYIRQVVFGNCNPKRQVGYEKYLMFNQVLTPLVKEGLISESNIYSLCSDEIIIDTAELTDATIRNIDKFTKTVSFPLKTQVYVLGKIEGTDAFIKNISTEDGKLVDKLEPKCVNPMEAPAIYRFLNDEQLKDEDYYFLYNGRLARFVEQPEISIRYN